MLGSLKKLVKKIYNMFTNANNVIQIGCAMQLTLDNTDGHNINDNHIRISELLQNEISKLTNNQIIAGLQVVDFEIPQSPFRLIEIPQNNYIYGYIAGGVKINQNMLWCGINHINGNVPDHINSFLTFLTDNITTIANIRNITRIGIVQTNTQLNRVITAGNGFNVKETIIEKNIRNADIEATCRIAIRTVGDNYQIDVDIVVERNIELQNALTIVRQISNLIPSGEPFNLFQLIQSAE
jgi:hypothetical protein